MFSFPLPLPQNTLYSKLGVDPEASEDELRTAKADFVRGLDRRKATVDSQVEQVFEQVEGLRQAYAEQRDLANKGRGVEEALAAATRRVHLLEKQALALCPDFARLRQEAEALEAEINEVNSLGLEMPENRLNYDRQNPPLALLKLHEWPRAPFGDNKVALALLRRELAEFLAALGVDVFHPSDLTRQDFYGDFTHSDLLDGPQS